MKNNELYYGIKRIVTSKELIIGDGLTPQEIYLNSKFEYKTIPIDYLILRKKSDEKYQDIFSKIIYKTSYFEKGDIFIDDRPGYLIAYKSDKYPNQQEKTNLKTVKKELEKMKEIISNLFIGYLVEVISVDPKEEMYKPIQKTIFYKNTEHNYTDIKTKKVYKDYALKKGDIIVEKKLIPLLEENTTKITNQTVAKTMIKARDKFNKKEYGKND